MPAPAQNKRRLKSKNAHTRNTRESTSRILIAFLNTIQDSLNIISLLDFVLRVSQAASLRVPLSAGVLCERLATELTYVGSSFSVDSVEMASVVVLPGFANELSAT